MIVTISPSTVSGHVGAPSSKSCTQRAYAAALINDGTTIISNAGKSNDEQAAKKIIEDLGADVKIAGKEIIVTSSKNIFSSALPGKSSAISCGESGLSLRMFAPLAALFSYEIAFTGEGSILKRPVNFFEETFPQLGVEIKTNNGMAPLLIKGPLKPADITVDGSLSSQFLTGLLMAFARACTVPVSITVKNLSSRPYIDLTVGILHHFGFRIDNDNYEKFIIHPASINSGNTIRYTVEGDWSNVAFLLVAGAIAGDVTVSNADFTSSQGDKNIMEALKLCGASIHIDQKEITVSKNNLTAFDFDATHSPDLFPPLVALAAYCEGTSTIKGVNRLQHKESDRGFTLKTEFEKMGLHVEINDDMMAIEGPKRVKGAKVTSHNDHRIAMACAVAALGAEGITTISEADAVKKSYPGFFDDLKMLKASLQIS
ncbi:MAG: 3-phosphoshikimate 1-carboxyvinyltransferase [Ginsengibacter sp.]